jgi:hypothetical protein
VLVERSASTIRVARIILPRSVLWLIVAANIRSTPILVTLMMEAILSSET